MHLRAHRAAIALEARNRSCAGRRCSGRIQSGGLAVVELAIRVDCDCGERSKADHCPSQTTSLSRTAGGTRTPNSRAATRSQYPHRAQFSIGARFRFECENFVQPRAAAALRERRDMHENLFVTLGGGDEAEAAIIVPFLQAAVASHRKTQAILLIRQTSHACSSQAGNRAIWYRRKRQPMHATAVSGRVPVYRWRTLPRPG